jgi:riboflavin kinase/FMN adenylyltransferase
MRIIEWPQFLHETVPFGGKPAAMTVGVFDGVHRGHRLLIERVVAHKDTAVPVVITFRQSHHKKSRSGLPEYPGDILSFRQKTAVMESLGVAVIIVIEFSENFRQTGGIEFFRILREHGNMGFLTVGSNFRCGYRLDTGAQEIQQFTASRSIPTDIVRPLQNGPELISSSQIRTAIVQGNLKAASAMLGYPFTLDLDNAARTNSGNKVLYDIAGQGRILPPEGSYQARLSGKNGVQLSRKPATVLVEGGNIIIDKNSAGAEYVEFSV